MSSPRPGAKQLLAVDEVAEIRNLGTALDIAVEVASPADVPDAPSSPLVRAARDSRLRGELRGPIPELRSARASLSNIISPEASRLRAGRRPTSVSWPASTDRRRYFLVMQCADAGCSSLAAER